MQTFLPYRNFDSCAKVLDRQRLGKQRVETLQIMTALATGQGWIHHPATKMWRGHEGVLLQYQDAIVSEWLRRGYKDTCMGKTDTMYLYLVKDGSGPRTDTPPWLGKRILHSSHRANLLRKNPDHYGQFGWPEKPAEGYYWPVS